MGQLVSQEFFKAKISPSEANGSLKRASKECLKPGLGGGGGGGALKKN